MVARPGDYRITDPVAGSAWSVSPEALAVGYREMGDGVYESRGEVEARQIADGAEPEWVWSREGLERAHPGDWVVQDPEDQEWVVPDRWFRSRYTPSVPRPGDEEALSR
jgi:hypothetical protein